MSTYRKIHGRSIQAVTTDPSESVAEGQVWYNTTSDTFKTVLLTEAWASGGPLGTARYAMGAAGTQSAALGFGGAIPPSPGFATQTLTEEYNGAGWATSGALGTARYYIGGCGSQTAGLAFGGNSGTRKNETEEYNGSTWSEQNNLSTARRSMGSSGTQTAALASGGDTPPSITVVSNTEQYDGTSWTNGGALNTARSGVAMGPAGIQTAAVIAGGYTGSVSDAVEHYDGSSWTNATSLPAIRSNSGFAGLQTAGLVFGAVSPARTTSTLKYDGTSWTTAPSLATTVGGNVGTGTQSAALNFGGSTSSTVSTANTEEFTASINVITAAAWAAGGAAPSGTSGSSMAGYKDDAMMWGGDTGGSTPGWPTTSHSYNGSSWTSDGTIPTQVTVTGQAGAGHTDAIMWGGYQPPGSQASKTHEYNGSSWTAGGDLNDSRQYGYNTGAGPQTACIAIGGGGNIAEHENYNGTAWSEETDFPSGANFVGTIGTQTATLAVSGANGTTATWNGSAWTAVPSTLNTPRQYGAAGGANSSEGYMFGGGPPSVRNQTELYNGTTWASQPNMANGRNTTGGSGISNSGLIAGSFYPNNTNVEEFTAETTTVNVKTLTQS